MGKGIIVNHIADGEYNVTIKIDDSFVQDTIIKLDDAILHYNSIILELQAKKSTAWTMYDSAKTKFNIILIIIY